MVKSAPHYTETAADEIRLLEVIGGAAPFEPNCEKIVKLLNHFTVRGVNGVHTCLVFEALGCSLYKLIVKNNYQGLALPQVKAVIKQVRKWFLSECFTSTNIILVIGVAGFKLFAHKMSHYSYRYQTGKYSSCYGQCCGNESKNR